MAIWLALLLPAQRISADPPPNVVLIVTDDQGWTGTSVQMDPSIPNSVSDFYQTPNLERLAGQGMRFSNAYASAPNCSPTRAAIQTGKSPAQLHMTDIVTENFGGSSTRTGQMLTPPLSVRDLSGAETTIAERIKAAKPQYITAHFGKWHLAGGGPGSHGYDFHDGATGNIEGNGGDVAGDPKRIFSVTQRANDFIETRVAAGDPFFMQVSHYALHHQIHSALETKQKYDRLPAGKRHFFAPYAAMTEHLDTGVGTLLDKIDELGITDNTYVIYVSDNGADRVLNVTNNIPLSEGKLSLWEGGTRVPMVVRGPGIQADSTSRVPVTTTDLFPTISNLLGIDAPLPKGLEGGSIRRVLENSGEGIIDRSSEALFWHVPNYQSQVGTTPVSTVRMGDYKLIKFYETGELKLFNLANDIGETNNLANLHPEQRDRLHQMLNEWLEDVDASIPYRVADDVELSWSGDHLGSQPGVWRATTDVQHKDRESWVLSSDSPPTRVAIAPDQPNLPRHAFQFDGTSGMTHKFFHVSDPDGAQADHDHSATFEMWLKIDSLTDGNQVLFETGARHGLSLTLGDDNADGIADAVRLRARGAGSNSIAVTAKINPFNDPTRDFVHLVGVIDDGAETSAELFVNGASVAHTDAGSITIDWDGVNEAGLGIVADELGAGGGPGDRPFAGGPFTGQIAQFRFFNRSLDKSEILDHYNMALSHPGHGIASAFGDVDIPVVRPASVSEEKSDSAILVFHERTTQLDHDLEIDVVAPEGDTTFGNPGTAVWHNGIVPAGTEVNSYFLHFDPIGNSSNELSTTATLSFDNEILGLIIESESLNDTDIRLGIVGRYTTYSMRGLDLRHTDRVAFFDANHGLTVNMAISGDSLDQLRVITAVPEPATVGLLLCFLLLLFPATARHRTKGVHKSGRRISAS